MQVFAEYKNPVHASAAWLGMFRPILYAAHCWRQSKKFSACLLGKSLIPGVSFDEISFKQCFWKICCCTEEFDAEDKTDMFIPFHLGGTWKPAVQPVGAIIFVTKSITFMSIALVDTIKVRIEIMTVVLVTSREWEKNMVESFISVYWNSKWGLLKVYLNGFSKLSN